MRRGGINGTPRAGTGGTQDTTTWGLSTGGITGTGRGLSAATGGLNEGGTFGRNTGGIHWQRNWAAEMATSIASVPLRAASNAPRFLVQ
jgi:hypothetical protein